MPYVSIEEVLDAVKGQTKGEINVCLPAKVLSYDSATQTATVQPTVRTFFYNEDGVATAEKLPAIPKAPVAYFQTGDFAMHAPLKAGDNVTLVVADRSIDAFMATNNADTVARDARRFDWTDAIVLPQPPSPDAIEALDAENFFVGLKDGSAGVTYTPAGKTLYEAGGEELLQTLLNLLDVLPASTTGVGVNTFDPATVVAINAAKLAITNMKA